MFELDRTIRESAHSSKKKEQAINLLISQTPYTTDPEILFEHYQEVFSLLRYYNMSQALEYVEKQMDVALKNENRILEIRSKLNRVEIFSIMGMYMEAFDVLREIDREGIDDDLMINYYNRHAALYQLLAQNTSAPVERKRYQQLVTFYRDSVLMIAVQGSPNYQFARSEELIYQGKYAEALEILQQFYRENGEESPSFGTLTYILSEIYALQGNVEKQKQYLAISAISDLRRGVKEHIALRKLATLLYHADDKLRAYVYAKSALEDATFSGAQFRILELSETLPIIIDAYEQKIRREKQNLLISLAFIMCLVLLLMASVLYIWQQMKKLAKAKIALKSANDHLMATNLDLDKLNHDLDRMNRKLLEANLVKEAYIGHFLDLCSDYIRKLEKFKSTLNKKAMDKKWDELQKVLKSNEIINSEREELFENFDRIFLHLYPTFVDDFNVLLAEEGRFIAKENELLNVELRIFALIRLGITDSSKIAQFLNYSPTTIYNYRTRTKNKAIIPRENFETTVMKIGKIVQ